LSDIGHANELQGYFGEAFVSSIAAAAGLDVLWPRLGHRIDLMVFRAGPKGTSTSRQMSLQVKSWSQGMLGADDCFHYPLKVPAFKYLASANEGRHYLVLCLVPDDAAQYANVQHESLRLFQAAYWLSLRDEAPDLSLPVDSTKTVLVPRTHLLTTETIGALVDGDEAKAVTR
jgi:hypothetical protein